MRKASLLLTVLLITTFRALAYDPINQWMLFNGSYTYDGSKANSGMNLGSNAVNAITMDAAGNIWFAVTGKGVRMWDGKKLNDPKLPKDSYALNAEVLSIATDSKGTVWVGTSEGLVKYDGSAWTNIGADVTGLQAVREIVVTPTDKVYLAGLAAEGARFTGGGLAFYNGQGWTKFDASAGMPDTLVQHLTLDANNHLWMTFGADDMGLAKFDGKNWKLFNTGNGLPTDNIRAIATNKSGRMYFAATSGLLEYDGSAWNLRPYNTGFGPKLMDLMATKGGELDVQSLMVEDNGTVWLGIRNGGVYNVRHNYARYFDAYNSLLPGNSLMQMLKDKAGNKWMLTGQRHPTWHRTYYDRNHPMYSGDNNGVVVLKEYDRITDPKWTVYDNLGFHEKLGGTYAIGEDASGMLIPNDAAGLMKLKDGKLSVIRHPKGDFANAFTEMYQAPDGKVYLSTTMSGIKVLDNGAISDFAKWPNMGGVLGMSYDKNNVLWSAGTGGLSRWVNGEWETFNKKHGDLPSVIVYSVFKDSKGQLWAGTAKGLVTYNETTFTKVETEFPSDDIQTITEDAKGRIWVGSNKGLSIYDGSTWTHISKVESPKLKNFRVNEISFDRNGVAWMATETDGLLRYDGTTWTQYDKKSTGTLFDRITAVKAGSEGKIYVASQLPEFGQSDFAMPNATGDEAIRQGIATKIKAGDPKVILAIIEP